MSHWASALRVPVRSSQIRAAIQRHTCLHQQHLPPVTPFVFHFPKARHSQVTEGSGFNERSVPSQHRAKETGHQGHSLIGMHPLPETPSRGPPGQERPSKPQACPALLLPLQMTMSMNGSSGHVGRAGTRSWVTGPSCECCSCLCQVSFCSTGIGGPRGQAVVPKHNF